MFKQMKLLTLGGGFSEDELSSFKHIIFSNCISQMKILVANGEKLNINLELPENAVRPSLIVVVDARTEGTGSPFRAGTR